MIKQIIFVGTGRFVAHDNKKSIKITQTYPSNIKKKSFKLIKLVIWGYYVVRKDASQPGTNSTPYLL